MRTLPLLLAASTLVATDISFDVENFTADHGISRVILKVTNNGDTTARMVFINCAFLDEDMKAIDIGPALIVNLMPGESKYEEAAVPTTSGVEHAHCYVDKVSSQ